MAVIAMAATINGTDVKINPTHPVVNATGNNILDIMLSPWFLKICPTKTVLNLSSKPDHCRKIMLL
jgi:hypothetical protein